MEIGYDNNKVYEFLLEECKHHPNMLEKYGKGLIYHTADVSFFEELGEQLDCFRICEECGKPMIEGYVVDGCNTYCSDDCLFKNITPEEYENSYDNGKGDSYWTTWYEDSLIYRMKNLKK